MWALSGLPALATVARVASETRLESGESAEAGAVRSGVSRTRSVVPRWRVAVPAAPAPVGGAHVGRSAVAGAPRRPGAEPEAEATPVSARDPPRGRVPAGGARKFTIPYGRSIDNTHNPEKASG